MSASCWCVYPATSTPPAPNNNLSVGGAAHFGIPTPQPRSRRPSLVKQRRVEVREIRRTPGPSGRCRGRRRDRRRCSVVVVAGCRLGADWLVPSAGAVRATSASATAVGESGASRRTRHLHHAGYDRCGGGGATRPRGLQMERVTLVEPGDLSSGDRGFDTAEAHVAVRPSGRVAWVDATNATTYERPDRSIQDRVCPGPGRTECIEHSGDAKYQFEGWYCPHAWWSSRLLFPDDCDGDTLSLAHANRRRRG